VGSSKKQTVGYKYLMGQHLGFSHGPVDAVLEFRAGDRAAWSGEVTESETININAPELFGGDEREGGMVGTLDVLMGEDTQAPHPYLEAQLGAPIPAFRGLFTAVYRGIVSSNNPYLKAIAVRVRRMLQGWEGGSAWYPEKAKIQLSDIAPTIATFTEDYSDGLDAYDAVQGGPSLDGFTIDTGLGSLSMRIDGAAAATARTIRRFTPQGEWRGFAVEATLNEAATDDNAVLYFTSPGSPSDTVIGILNINRQAASAPDLVRQATFWAEGSGLDSGTGIALTPAVLDPLLVYRFEGDYLPDEERWELRVYEDGSLVNTVSMAATSGPGIINGLRFQTEVADGLAYFGPVTYTHLPASGVRRGANPAHVVYECLTNRDWGMGYPTGALDAASFAAAADKFYAEGMALCMTWAQQTSIEGFVQLVMDHAGAACSQDPKTGLFTLRPIRADYVLEDLPLFAPSEGNILELVSLDRSTYTEAMNELTVKYTDSATGKDGSVTVQQLASIQAQGGIVPETRNYPGLPTSALALRVAMRDLRASSSGLARVKLRVNRQGSALEPGDVIGFAWPRLGIALTALRVLQVNTGTTTDAAVSLVCVQDVFGLPDSTYVDPPTVGWVEPNTSAQASPAVFAFETPYRDLLRFLGAANVAALDAAAGFVSAAAAKPPGFSLNYELRTRVAPAAYEATGTGDWAGYGLTDAALEPLDDTVVLTSASLLEAFEVGEAVLLGDETCRVDAVDAGTSTLTLARGCGDTPPRAWPLGTPVVAVNDLALFLETEYADGEAVDAKVLTRTTSALLAEALAPTATVTMDQRQARPYAPGLLRITDLVDTAAAYPTTLRTGALTVSWAHRDRLLQQDTLVPEADASVGPEPGVTYTVRYYLDGVLDDTESGISGTSATPYTLSGAGLARVEVVAVRDSLESWSPALAEFPYTPVAFDARVTDGADNRITDSGDRRITD
jgi:hypothetical protein